ncbi:Protein of unknown function [Bacillus cereus]|nr:Protein of unknown function [Bacillus cereus]
MQTMIEKNERNTMWSTWSGCVLKKI